MAVKKIAHNDQLLRFKVLHLGSKPLNIFFKNCLRYSNAVLAKVSRLAKVQIRKDECFFFFPKNTPAGRKQKAVVEDRVLYKIHRAKISDTGSLILD